MTTELRVQRVEVSFVSAPPLRQIERASGVSRVEVDGRVVRCLVTGSFQPFLEALRGHEVISLSSTRAEATDIDNSVLISGEDAMTSTMTAMLAPEVDTEERSRAFRAAGGLYLLLTVTSIFSFAVIQTLPVAGDAAATVATLLESETLFRFALVLG